VRSRARNLGSISEQEHGRGPGLVTRVCNFTLARNGICTGFLSKTLTIRREKSFCSSGVQSLKSP